MNFLRAVLFEDDDEPTVEERKKAVSERSDEEMKPLKEGVEEAGDEDEGEKDVREEDAGEKDVGDKDVGEKDVGEKDVIEKDVGGKDVREMDVGERDAGKKDERDTDQGNEDVEEKYADDEDAEEPDDDPKYDSRSSGLGFTSGIWGFSDLVKTITLKSEELLSEYRGELQEFSSGLKKETEEFVEITGHKVKDLPSTLQSGAQVAQESLEEVGHTLEEFGSSFWRGTREIFAQVREAVALVEEEAALNAKAKVPAPAYSAGIQRGKYSRYEALVSAMQRDSSTYCDEPEDTEEYASWRNSFKLEDKKPDIDNILKDNAFMQELQSRIVPVIVEHETFWTRYFYRLHKLQQVEDARAGLVKRAANTEEEELSWDVDEDGDTPSGSNATTPGAASNESASHAGEKEAKRGATDSVEDTNLQVSNKGTDKKESDVPPETSQAQIPAATKSSHAAPAESHEEEGEGQSDGSSAGSEWQVVSKDDSPSAVAAEKVKAVGEADKGSVTEAAHKEKAGNAEEGSEKVEEEAASPTVKNKDGKGQKDTGGAPEEDWGEWE